jgi:hypothetical protein
VKEWVDPRHLERVTRRIGPPRLAGCFRCDGDDRIAGPDYVYLLGLYLGDGSLSGNAKGVWRLRIVQDRRYVRLISECRLAIGAVTPNRVAVTKQPGCVEIGASWKHWVHLFPQHGPGPKWLRRIVMEPWQRTLIEAYPGQLLRGLIHSDGCRILNTVYRRWSGKEAQYRYPRYFFTNASADIRVLFTDVCDLVNVR